jgi:Uma2 family endonuclease
VLSPRTERLDRKKKLPMYGRMGIPFAWLINPATELLEVLRRTERGTWELLSTHEGDELVQSPPFEAVPIELSALWGR